MLVCVALSGCALFGSGKKPLDQYDLSPSPHVSLGQRLEVQIVINRPSAARSLDTERILVKSSSAKLAYYPGAAWSDRLPQLVQGRLVEAMQNSGRFRAVGDDRDKIHNDIQLLSNIRVFHVDVAGEVVTARIEIFMKLVDGRSQRILSSRKFSASSVAAGDSADAAIEALNQAHQKIIPQIVKWAGRRRIVAHVQQ